MKNRITAEMEGPFVVFLIGMRINHWWRLDAILPVIFAMGRMLTELHQNKNSGFLSYESWFGRTICMVQYWNSHEQLQAFANDRSGTHFPAWMAYYQKLKKAGPAVGIWHETYLIEPGKYETIYGQMPLFGLAKAGRARQSPTHEMAPDRMKTPQSPTL